MKWLVINNSARVQPTSGSWPDWKEQIAESCSHQCVYCAIHESRYGGRDTFHVDHFRPKSLSRFKSLSLKITNLYLACAICNRFKSNDWPADPTADLSTPCYPDPGEVDYSDIFGIGVSEFELSGKNISAKYVVQRLYLNRPQLIRERRVHAYVTRLTKAIRSCEELLSALRKLSFDETVFELICEISERSLAVSRVLIAAQKTIPYDLADIRKPLKPAKPKKGKRPKP